MLIRLNAADFAQIKRLAAVHHRHGELQRFLAVHAANKYRHEKCRHLIIGDIPLRIAVYNILYLLGGKLQAVTLFYDYICHQHIVHLLFVYKAYHIYVKISTNNLNFFFRGKLHTPCRLLCELFF